jgi:hypothetical protein
VTTSSMKNYASSRTQKVVSLLSCKGGLCSIVSWLCSCLLTEICLIFCAHPKKNDGHFADSPSTRQLVARYKGCRKMRHMSIEGNPLGPMQEPGRRTCDGADSDILQHQRCGCQTLSKTRLLAWVGEVGML